MGVLVLTNCITRQDRRSNSVQRDWWIIIKIDLNEISYFVSGDPQSIRDKDAISPYAYDAVSLCFKYYINMFKTDFLSHPQDSMTRGELAAEFYRCLKFIDRNL